MTAGAHRGACSDFYERYESDPLIIDKWLGLQAMIPEAGTLDRVRALTAHPAFSINNPNRVRSLIGSFAQGNPTQFNRADGAGYEFVADTVLALDPGTRSSPRGMPTAFKSWRALETGRAHEARRPRCGALRTASALSRDVERHRQSRAGRSRLRELLPVFWPATRIEREVRH